MLRTLVLMVVALLSANVAASNATLSVDQTKIEKDQTITATFTYKGQFDGEPDFSVLNDDFTVMSQGLSRSVEIINGNYRQQQSWNTVLLPKRVGSLEIPPVDFGGEKSNAVTLTVTPAKPRSDKDLGDLFLEAELTPEGEGYVQQQHIFTLRIYFRGWLIDGDLSDPQLGTQDVVVQSLGEPRRYSVTRNGERYQVYERRHALFPQASGELTLGETTFSGRLRLPVGGNRLKSVSIPSISRTVLPVPTEFTGDVWLPADTLSITEVWPGDKLVFEQGVPITRTITLGAIGLTSAQLPVLTVEGNDDVRVYPDQPKSADQVGEQGVVGTRAIAIAMVPQRAGNIELPAVEVKWWDTATNKERVARLAPRTLSVLAAAGSVQAVDDAGPFETSVEPVGAFRNPWFYATVACALGWLLTVVLRGRSRGQEAFDVVTLASSHGAQRRLKNACRKNDAKACVHLFSELLREPSAGHWFEGKDGHELKRQWQRLNQHLYGQPLNEPGSERVAWAGGLEFWQTYERVSNRVETDAFGKSDSLAELAPIG